MKCDLCNKKVVIVVTCSCKKVFCLTHRMPEDHACAFDFKEKTKDLLNKQMHVVSSEKLQNRI